MTSDSPQRLQKIIAAAGIASRRKAEELITEGRVQVNGQVVTELGTKADPAHDHIRVDGKLLHGAERPRYYLLNKPRGYVTTASDPEGRPTVMDLIKGSERVFPVGRLDYSSEGLLLMTNDGELANKLTRAASGVEKTYLVKVSGQPNEDLVDQIRQGISIDKGRPGEGRVRTAPAHIRQVRVGENPWYEVGLIEGRNRELRKMFEEIGHHVEKIRRVGYGPLVLDQEPGHFRELDAEELQVLRLAADGKWKPKRVKTTAMLPPHSGRSVDHERGKSSGKPFRGREDRRPPARPGGTGERREASRPSYGRTQERGKFDRPSRPSQGGFAGRTDRSPRPAQSPREGGFADRRGPQREFPRRPVGESDRGARGGSAPRPGGFGAQAGPRGANAPRPGGFSAERGAGNARRPGSFPPRREGGPREGGSREAGFQDRRPGGFSAKPGGATGAGTRFAGPRAGGKPPADRSAGRPFEAGGPGRERPPFSGGERREGGQGDRFRPRPQGPAEGGYTARPAGRSGERAGGRQGERPQGRPAFGRGNFAGPPRGPSAGSGSRGPAADAAGRGYSGGRPPSTGRTSQSGGGQFKRTGSSGGKTGGPPRGSSAGGGSRRPSGGPRRGGPSQGRPGSGRGNSGRRPGTRPPR